MAKQPWHILFILIAAALFGGSTACKSAPDYPEVSLAAEPLPDDINLTPEGLQMAVAAVISPQGTMASYLPVVDYLSDHMDESINLVQRQTYAEVNDLLQAGVIDFGFICTGAYVQIQSDVELLVAPQVNGEVVYYSYIIVSADSDITNLDDLSGQRFAFTDPLSNSGRLSIVHHLWQQDIVAEDHFGELIYTYSHDNSVHAVADRLVDGAAVDSLVYDYTVQRYPELSQEIRIIEKLGPYGIPPVVVSRHLDDSIKTALRQTLLSMHQTQKGQQILSNLGIERFVEIDVAQYESVRQMLADLEVEP